MDVRNEFSSRLDAGALKVHPRAEVVERRHAFCRQNSVQRSLKKTVGVEELEENWLLKGKNVTKHQQLHKLCPDNNCSKHGIEKTPNKLEKLSKL